MIDPAWAQARSLLAVRLDNLGDVLLMTPAIHAIRRSLPAARITLLASPVGAQVAALNPDIDDVIVYQAPWMDPWQTLPLDPEREAAVIAEVRDREFDAALIFSSYRQSPLPSAYLCYLAGIPLRLAATTDGPGSLLTTRHRPPDGIIHEVERGLDLVGAVGLQTDETDLVLHPTRTGRTEARRLLARNGGRPAVVLHPGCSMPARTYPWELFARVADGLISGGATVYLTGAEAERDLTERIAARLPHQAVNLAGKLPFDTFCALIEAADLTVTNNTGPMHISAAVKTPVVSLFALTNYPQQWGPWHVPHRQLYRDVSCRICYQRACPYSQDCLQVPPEVVVAAAWELLAEGAVGGAA